MPLIYYPTWPKEVLADQYSVFVDIYELVPPEPPNDKDERGNPLPPVKQYIVQDEPADLQPKGGGQRALQSGTTYEASHTLYMRRVAATIAPGVKVDVKDTQGGPVRQTLTVVFVADWSLHLELDVKV